MLHIGDVAPPFKLVDQHGDFDSLAWYGGWRLVWWLPSTLLEHASGCGDRIAAEFAKHAEEGEDRLTVLGVSFDTPAQHLEFAKRGSIMFPLLSADVETGQVYGVYRGDEDEWNCFPRKRAFLVDPDGRIAKVYTSIDPDFFVHEVLDDLEELAPRKGGFLSRALAVLKG